MCASPLHDFNHLAAFGHFDDSVKGETLPSVSTTDIHAGTAAAVRRPDMLEGILQARNAVQSGSMPSGTHTEWKCHAACGFGECTVSTCDSLSGVYSTHGSTRWQWALHASIALCNQSGSRAGSLLLCPCLLARLSALLPQSDSKAGPLLPMPSATPTSSPTRAAHHRLPASIAHTTVSRKDCVHYQQQSPQGRPPLTFCRECTCCGEVVARKESLARILTAHVPSS